MRKLLGQIATTLFALGMAMANPATASADHGPEGRAYEETRGHAGPAGAWSDHTTSCVAEDGAVYHRKLEKRADRDGETTRDSRSGDPSACHRGLDRDRVETDASRSPHDGNGGALVSTGDINVAPGDIVVLSPPVNSGEGEPEPPPRAHNNAR